VHVQLSSAGRAFGVCDIDRDVEEIGTAIGFLRGLFGANKGDAGDVDIVLMGHSTGCQDTMRYLTAPNPISERRSKRPVVQGAILQAPVSDREALNHEVEDSPEVKGCFERAMKIVRATSENDYRDVLLPLSVSRPLFGPAPLSISRLLSLASPGSPGWPSVEDFFSSDLSEETLRSTFGKIGENGLLWHSAAERETQSILILMSDADQWAKISQKDVLARWKNLMTEDTGAAIHGESAVIANAKHDVSGEDWSSLEARLVVLRRKVLRYLEDVVGDVGDDAHTIWRRDRDRVAALKEGEATGVEETIQGLKL